MPIRNHRGRFVSAKAMNERVDALKNVQGVCLGYAWRSDAPYGSIASHRVSGEWAYGVRFLTVTGEASDAYGEPYVSFDAHATGEDRHGYTSFVNLSNYRSIRRDFPQYPWVDTAYSNVDCLGIFVADLDDDMLATLVGLVEQYPVYDEDDLSEVEQEATEQSWDAWVKSDLWRELSEPIRTMWDVLGEDMVQDLWWACASEGMFGSYPECCDGEVKWGDMRKRAQDFRPYLIHAYVSVRQGSSLPAAWDMVPMVSKFRHVREGRS